MQHNYANMRGGEGKSIEELHVAGGLEVHTVTYVYSNKKNGLILKHVFINRFLWLGTCNVTQLIIIHFLLLH